MQWRKFTRLKAATGHSRTRRMLCCGRRKENGRSVPDLTASPGRAPPGPMPSNQANIISQQRQGVKEPVLLQGDFRKVSGISSEIFRQIEAVENDHDPSTAAALESVERRGEMIVRILEPRCIGGRQAVEAAQKLMTKGDARHTVQLVEIVKRPGQTLGLYIREGNGADRSDGVFISRIALESAVYNSGCLRVGDEILAVNLVDVTRMSLDDVVIIMSIPRRLVLAIRQRRGGRGANSPGPPSMTRPEQKPPPVVVIKRDLREEDLDMMEQDRPSRSRSSRERRTGDGREMTESRSRLGLGLNNYSPQSEQLDLYYNSRPSAQSEPPSWGYKPPPPPSVITEQPKGAHQFTPSHAYYQNAGTLESLAEKVHSFYPSDSYGPSRRMSAGGIGSSQSHQRFPRSGSDQHLPRVEYSDFSSLGRHSLLRSSLKTGTPTGGGTLGRYGRYDPPSRAPKYGVTPSSSLARRSRPTLDYSSDTEATIGPRPSYYYYNRPALPSLASSGRASVTGMSSDLGKFNSLPRERPSASRLGLRSRLGDRLLDEGDGNWSGPELPPRDRVAELRSRLSASPSIFTSDEYRAWLRRAPSSSAISEQMRASRGLLGPHVGRFSCSAENIHDALKNTESIYSSRTGAMSSTLDRHMGGPRGALAGVPVRSLSSQHLGTPSSLRSPSMRRMRQLLELSSGPGSPAGSSISGHQSPAPTPSATLPRPQRQIDINPAEFVKYKLDKPVMDVNGISGMLWIHLLAGRGLRATPEGTQTPQPAVRDLYCVLECDRVHKARTVVRSGDLQFDWDESFELDLVCNRQLDVLVYSWDPQHRHKLCYRGAVSLATILRQSPLHQLALKVEPRGTIYLRVRHTDPSTLYRRRGLPSLRAGYPQLFGADLETVVTREAKGAPGSAPVPIVLRRCVEEVERRGLDIIGLYRLCGSATKKRLLREAFERNSRAVELSPDHVPDINVITGVLKDYLRELPEPLFTRCLFQMTLDALAVCLPDDPEGNAKLMLSILDCLPRANRATLVFLLDHLSLVVSASDRNKMSAQALATVMGPPLMLHSTGNAGENVDHAQPIAVLKYLLQIWPQPHTAAASDTVVSAFAPTQHYTTGRRSEPIGQRGNRASALQVGKPQASSNLHISPSVAGSSPSQGPLPLSATLSNRASPSAVGLLAQSPRASPIAVQQHHPSAVSAVSAVRVQSPPATPSPGSSSASTSGSESGTDTVKRGASPAMSLSSVASASTVRLRESGSSHSVKPTDANGKPQKNGASDINPSTTEQIASRSGFNSTDTSSLTNYLSKMSAASSSYGQPLRSTITPSSTATSETSSFMLRNQIMSTLGSYQFPSTSLSSRLTDTTSSVSALASEYLRKTQMDSSTAPRAATSATSSPFASTSKGAYQPPTDTIASIMARTGHSPTFASTTANGDTATSHTESVTSSSSSALLYGTLPKNGSPYTTRATTNGGGSTSPYSSSTTNNIDLYGGAGGNGFTYGTYRVQYSSTNPFLPTYNPAQCEPSQSAIPSITITSKDSASAAISTTTNSKIDTE
ncbi:rho GTPase-activating protein 100F isoform X4 [Lutzomyia longipalpis]|uniref:rho GTPase-activating protein 100F isoform X4 n=1 Tax=Lutzomyia longipalpis TaxID=7200 RepID=UPI0024845CCF|nr:rho GTPase-activating protein 100F isoform X4 [Lutzomyia longipalpis]